MLHIIHPEYTWFLMYSSLFVTFAFYTLSGKTSVHDALILITLFASSVVNLPVEEVQKYTSLHKSVLFETTLTIASLSLVARYFSKKLLWYLFFFTAYLTGIAIAHTMEAESTIIPAVSLLLLISLLKSYSVLPSGCHTKNGIYFITILTLIAQNILNTSEQSQCFLVAYGLLALYTAVKSFFEKDHESKVFYAFFSFFVTTITYAFLQGYALVQIAYMLLYSVTAYFLYATGKDHHPAFTLHCLLAFSHICYIIFNPSYFLLHTLYSQAISQPLLQSVIMFTYFTIIISIIGVIIHGFKAVSWSTKFNIIKFAYITTATAILVETQIFHALLSNTGEISYMGTVLIFILHIFYGLASYAILTFLKLFLKKKKFTKIKRIILPYIPKPSLRKIHIINRIHFVRFNSRAMFMEFSHSIKSVHEYTFVIIPVFLLFYLIISFIY